MDRLEQMNRINHELHGIILASQRLDIHREALRKILAEETLSPEIEALIRSVLIRNF